jgi:hypothetical protein
MLNEQNLQTHQETLATVVGSMNCMPTEYAVLLSNRGWKVLHYIDANSADSLSNPLIRHKNYIEISNICYSFMRFKHPFYFLLSTIFHRRLITQLNMSNLIILSGASISLARFIKNINKKTVLALGYGDDLSVFCNMAWPLARLSQRGFWAKLFFGWFVFILQNWFVNIQRKGLSACTHVAYFPTGFDPKTDKLLNELIKDDAPQRLTRYSINTDNLPILKPTFLATEQVGMKVMFPVRFSSSSDIFLGKGWKVFLDGVACYLKLRPKTNIKFYCFNKGDLVDEAKEYAKHLGVDNNIMWLNVVPFDILYSYMNDVDVIVDQLGDQWLGVGMWGALLGKPVISNLSKPAIRDKFSGSRFLHAEDAQQFAMQLISCESLEFRLNTAKINTNFAIEKLSLKNEFDTWGVTNYCVSKI